MLNYLSAKVQALHKEKALFAYAVPAVFPFHPGSL